MPALSIARPVENVRNLDEATAIALIDHLVPILENWRKAEDLRNQLPVMEAEIKANTAKLADDRPTLETIKSKRTKIFSSPGSYGTASIVASAIGVVCIGLGFLYGWMFFVGIVVLGIGAFLGYTRANDAHKKLTKEMVGLEGDIANASSALDRAEKARVDIEAEINTRSGGFPQVKIANVRFGLELAKIDGRTVLLDTSGCTDQTTLRAVDVSALQEGLSHISTKAEALLSVPPMLAPGVKAGDGDALDQLFGEERELQDLVGEFTLNLGRLRDISLPLPMVSKRSVLVKRLTDENPQRAGIKTAAERPSIDVSRGSISKATIRDFVSDVTKTKERGQVVFTELKEVFRNLEDACFLYANARTTSMNSIHLQLSDVLSRATWCGRRFYCPRTMLSPKYIQDLLGIDPARAFMLNLDDLILGLRKDPEIAKRLDEKMELQDELIEAYESVQSFMGENTFDMDGNRTSDQRGPKHMEDRLRASIAIFTNVLTRVMTGSSHPVLNFSAEAQLFFDPDPEIDEWRSDVVPYTYHTPDVVKYGGVVKAYSDLMLPLWEHLWTEKADFRKSELFRTNESMIRMSEKESEKLIEIGNQFRADMRTVRENVNLLESDLLSKHTEIISFRDGMSQLGLLSDRVKEAVSDSKLASMVIGKPVLPQMVKCETELNVLPQRQALIRGTALDPIDQVREPDALVESSGNVGVRLLSA